MRDGDETGPPSGGSRPSLSDAQRALLVGHIQEVEANAESHPALVRARMEAARDVAVLILRLVDSGDRPDDRAELRRLLRSASHWERGLLLLEPGAVWVLSDENLAAWCALGQPGQIWVRWDNLPTDVRATATSLASFLGALSGGRRRAGRPGGSHLTENERALIAELGPGWRTMAWQDGWRLMVVRGAWAAGKSSVPDPKTRRARASRWRRLIARFDDEEAREIGVP